ncbi:MAG TPA: 16S rRNA (cytosine(1402)-N(4))-methyltransferase RsmH [Longimicrobiales bacterium]|nr:16S rRNA (cytosine(1402)-N(4))-methyltransferase RsmH [Longimicrobiales bacterium]
MSRIRLQGESVVSPDDAARWSFHEPVLAREVVDLLLRGGEGLFLDGTVGGGGHARALLDRCPGCRLVGVDRDADAVARAEEVLSEHGDRVRLLRCRFDDALERAGIGEGELAGALLDLGVSSHQIDRAGRGFTFAPDAPLDMRMGGGDEDRPSAADLLNEADEGRLVRIFRDWGEEPRARRLAREVLRRRERRPFRSSDDLVGALDATLGRASSKREKARIFQAVRIAVNEELEALERALPALRDALRPGGVLTVLAYHSLEDRIVKNAFRDWSRSCVCPPRIPVCRCRGEPLGRTLTPGPIRPDDEEAARNPRSRSARLRGWRKAS